MEGDTFRTADESADNDHFDTLSDLLEDLYIPEVPEDQPVKREDFTNYLWKKSPNFSKIIELIGKDFEFSSDNSQKYKKKLLSPAIIVYGQHSTRHPWSTDATKEKSGFIVEKLLKKFGYSSITKALEDDQCYLLKDVLCKMRPWLLKGFWKKYPAAVICYKFLLEQMKSPHLSDQLSLVLPTALIIIDDFEIENRIIGLQCLEHIITEVGMTQLSWYNHDRVILKAIEPLFYYKDVEVVQSLTSTFVALINKNHPLRARKIFQVNEFDDIIDRFLQNMILEQRLDLRFAYITALPDIIRARGLGMVLHTNNLITILTDYLLEQSSCFEALEMVHAYIDTCWPAIQVHCTAFLLILCKACLGLQRERFTPECQKKFVSVIKKLKLVCPNKVNSFFSQLSMHPPFSSFPSSVLDRW